MATTSTKTAAKSGAPPWHSTWRRGVGIIIGVLVVILVCTPNASAKFPKTDCKHLGPGACRGQGWSDGKWPIEVGDKTLEHCCQSCTKTKGCTSFHLTKATGSTSSRLCYLFGHSTVSPAQALGGDCYVLPGRSTYDKVFFWDDPPSFYLIQRDLANPRFWWQSCFRHDLSRLGISFEMQ